MIPGWQGNRRVGTNATEGSGQWRFAAHRNGSS